MTSMDQHRRLLFFLFLPVQYYYSNHSKGKTTTTAGAQSTTHRLQAVHSMKSHTLTQVHTHTHTACSCVSHLVETVCIQAAVDLCCLFTTVDR